MSCDLLLYWMTHQGEGSWAGFRRAVSELAPNASDQNSLARRLRVALSDLGHVDFFVERSQRWLALPPMLAGAAMRDSMAVLCGSRTPQLITSLQSAAGACGCRLLIMGSPEGPSCVELRGLPADIQEAGNRTQIRFLPKTSAHLLGVVDSIADEIENAQHDERPFNWDAESFDLRSRTWVEGVQPNSACRFSPRYGASKFLLHLRRGIFLQLPKRDAVYASAMIRGVSLLDYDLGAGVIKAPVAAPMPEKLARIACLCTGAQPRIDSGILEYSGVPFDIASGLLVAAGQRHPGVPEFAQSERFSLG